MTLGYCKDMTERTSKRSKLIQLNYKDLRILACASTVYKKKICIKMCLKNIFFVYIAFLGKNGKNDWINLNIFYLFICFPKQECSVAVRWCTHHKTHLNEVKQANPLLTSQSPLLIHSISTDCLSCKYISLHQCFCLSHSYLFIH